MTAALRVSGLRRSYGREPVLRAVDLLAPAGALTAVVGPSGCGKTTLLRLIAGFDPPDAGTIAVGDTVLTGPGVAVAPERRRIGYVTQEGNLFPHLTVAANITFGLPRRARRARHRVGELLELLGLDPDHAARHPHQLSGGQQQRVALARALAPEPDVVLLDEPFSALDSQLRASTRRAVAHALASTGTTTLLVTHDRAEALSLADHLAVLRDGTIAQQGPPARLYREPADPGVAALLGDVVELPATVRDGRADTALGTIPTGRAAGAPTVLVRPEQITITDTGDGTVVADVLEVDFFGPHAIVRVRVGGLALTARCAGDRLPAVGDRIGLRVAGSAF